MNPYANLGGKSGIVAYETGPDWIDVQFSDGWIYRYTHASAGRGAIDQMVRLARAGQGLNGYISRAVRFKYESKRQG